MRTSTRAIIWVIDNMIWVILSIMVLIFGLTIPSFFETSNFINILYASAALSMIVLAQGICLISGNFDLSVESTIGFAPMIGVLLMTRWLPGFNPFLAIVATLLVGALIGLFNAYFVIRVKVNAFLQTLAVLIVLRGLMLFLVPLSIFGFPRVYSFPGGGSVFGIPVAIVIFLLIYLVMDIILKKTPFGRHLYAVGGNLQAAMVCGIKVDSVRAKAFVISGVLSAIGGLLMAGRMDSITNVMGEGQALLTFAGAILGGVSMAGGKGRVFGILGGVLLLGVIDNALTLIGLNPYLIYATKGIILFVAIVTDQVKVTLRQNVLMKEEIFKLTHASARSMVSTE